MTDRTVEGLPVLGDFFAKYAVVQAAPSRRNWEVKCQRYFLNELYPAMSGLDLSRPTRIVQNTDRPDLPVIRSWN